MYLIDTDVLSELRKARTTKIDSNVGRWWSTAELADFYLSVITLFELEEGTLRMERCDPAQGKLRRDWLIVSLSLHLRTERCR